MAFLSLTALQAPYFAIAGHGIRELQRELMATSRTMQTLLSETIAPICQQHGLTVQQLFVLVELSREPGQTISRLSEQVGILRTNFVSVCHKLEGAGLIERRRNEEDRRAVSLYLTKRGRALMDVAENEALAPLNRIVADEPPETIDAIIHGLKELRRLSEKPHSS